MIILTTYDLDEYVFDALRAGACGFLFKDVRAAELADAVRSVVAGGALLAPTVTLRMISQFARSPAPANRDRVLAALTPREGEVLQLIAHGLSNTETAARPGDHPPGPSRLVYGDNDHPGSVQSSLDGEQTKIVAGRSDQ